MRHFTIHRVTTHPEGIFGLMTEESGRPLCVTLEDPEDYIVPGTYKATRYLSPKFGYEVWLFHDVPGKTYIEIHIGNTKEDTIGCVLLGDRFGALLGRAAVLDSSIAFRRLMTDLIGVNEILVEIK